ncbi:unnamed protein product [Brassica oleracea]
MVEEKMRIPIAQVLGNILYLLRLKMEEAYKKLVRLEMVRRSLRMRADIRIMKHLVTWPTSKCYMLGVLSISSSKKACVAYTVVFPLPSWLFSRNWAMRFTNSAGLVLT